MSSRPRISIVTRTRNRHWLLARALRSIAEQTFADWRIALVDQGDAVTTGKILETFGEEFCAKVDHIVAPPDLTLGGLLNLGIRSSDSDFITRLDDDDTWHAEFLEIMERELSAKPGPDFGGIACLTARVDEAPDQNGNLVTLQEAPLSYFTKVRIQDLMVDTVFQIHAFLYERRCHEKVGYHDDGMNFGEDREFHIRFICHYEIAVVPQVLARYHFREQHFGNETWNADTATGAARKYGHVLHFNRRIRQFVEAAPENIAIIQAFGQLEAVVNQRYKSLAREIKMLRTKLELVSDKIGKIDSRTKSLKDGHPAAKKP